MTRLLSLGVDWLTTTMSGSVYGELRWNIERISAQLQRVGDLVKEQDLYGYKGQAVGQLFVGTREDGTVMVRVSGGLANELYPSILKRDVKVTRIDLQFTSQFGDYDGGWGEFVFDETKLARSQKTKKTPGHPRYLDGNGEGDTVWFGHRSSERCGRVYDKDRQSKDSAFENCWRYEVEYKGDLAVEVGKKLAESFESDRTIKQILAYEFERWEAPLPFVLSDRTTPVKSIRPTTDLDRMFKWVEKQVLPTITRLRDNGYGEALDQMLKEE